MKGLHWLAKMLVTKNLEVTANRVTIRESFQTGDIEILELGRTIKAPAWKHGGLVMEFRVIAPEPHQAPCPWKEERQIKARWIGASREAEAALVGEKDQVYVMISDYIQADVSCPAGYVWMGTPDLKVRVVQKMRDGQEEKFQRLQEDKESMRTNKQWKEDYMFFQLSKMIELKKKGKTVDFLRINRGSNPRGAVQDAKSATAEQPSR